MKIKFCGISILALLLAIFVCASPVFANGVKTDLGASGKGVFNADCAGTIQDNPACFEFTQVSGTQATWEAFSLTDFVTSTFTTIGPYDLFLVTGITDGTQVTLDLTGTNVAFGSFLCGSDTTMTTQLSGFCSDPNDVIGDDPSGIFSQIPDGSGNLETFTFNSSAPSTWVFYATQGDATISTSTGTTTPASEPSSLLLLAAGLTVVGLKLRRS